MRILVYCRPTRAAGGSARRPPPTQRAAPSRRRCHRTSRVHRPHRRDRPSRTARAASRVVHPKNGIKIFMRAPPKKWDNKILFYLVSAQSFYYALPNPSITNCFYDNARALKLKCALTRAASLPWPRGPARRPQPARPTAPSCTRSPSRGRTAIRRIRRSTRAPASARWWGRPLGWRSAAATEARLGRLNLAGAASSPHASEST